MSPSETYANSAFCYISSDGCFTKIYIVVILMYSMVDTTIRVSKSTKRLLEKLKIHPRETYNDVLKRFIKDGK